MEALEALLVRCTVDQCATPTTEDLLSEVRNHELLGDETVGAFRKILDEGDAIPLLQTGLVKLSPLLEKVDSSLNWIEKLEAIVRLTEGPDGATKDVRVGFFLVAVSSLLTFARANISGPPLEIAENPERYNPKLCWERFRRRFRRLELEEVVADTHERRRRGCDRQTTPGGIHVHCECNIQTR